MALDYNELAELAYTMITENGQPLDFFQQVATPADPAKPWRGAGADASGPPVRVTGVIIPSNQLDDEEAMRRGDSVAFVAALDFGPVNDMVMFDRMTDAQGYTWRVTGVNPLNPGPVLILYQVYLKH